MLLQLALASTASAAPDCQLSESDYYALREEIRDVRRGEGTSIGIAAEGARCQQALDAVIRNGPFLGVRRVEDDVEGPYHEQCIAVVRPGPDGYRVDRTGSCHDTGGSSPSRFVSVGYWMPLGASVRLNQDLGRGVSSVLDLGWQAPDLGVDPMHLGENLPPGGDSSKVRGLAGFDLARNGLMGSYVGFRAGVEYTTPAVSAAHATAGLVSFVLGHKWIGDSIAAQVGGGVLAVIPVGNGPEPESLYPAVELRLGATNH
ncbi:MAG: hypothetical protein R3F59_33895 [Myxococcota bacterium]